MTHAKNKKEIFNGDFKQNSFNVQAIAACSALVVISSLQSALVMSLLVTSVTTLSSFFISLLRKHIPNRSRVICQMSIISCLVIVVDLFLRVLAFDIAQGFSIFIGIITVNCLVISHAKDFAIKHSPLQSFLDGVRYSLGYSMILVSIGSIRELFGTGTLLGFEIFPLLTNGGWYQTNTFFTLPASAMFILALLVGVMRSFDKSKIEESDFTMLPNTKGCNKGKRHQSL